MEKVNEPLPAASPAKEPGRRMMRIGICVLAFSQLLPYAQRSAYIEQRYTGQGKGTYQNAYADKGYKSYVVGGEPIGGFEAHPYAFLILVGLFAFFFTRLYYRPGWSKNAYWAAIILALGCTELPPPIASIGGIFGAIALGLMGYSIYQRSQMPPAAEGGAG